MHILFIFYSSEVDIIIEFYLFICAYIYGNLILIKMKIKYYIKYSSCDNKLNKLFLFYNLFMI